ncbi:hypothetical protein BDZ91DRAFT_784246 [Kalaharituber pfeilii]|nr:hypothetical protein BDZ91DRAFT_784246 [Kalaharituber pfeilii]
MAHMTNSQNIEALQNQGQFHARKPRDDLQHRGGPLRIPRTNSTTWYRPPESTFTPQNDFNVTAFDSYSTGQPLVDPLDWPGAANAADVHQGKGHPGQGMTSRELRHDGQPKRVHQKLGLTRHAMSDQTAGGVDLGGIDARKYPEQRGLEKEREPNRGNKGEKVAEDQPGQTA